MNYYQTLGINRSASDAEIKSAYRKMAMKHHPDRGGDEKKFKEVEEAYRILSDPQKKQMVDMGVDPNAGPQSGFNQGPFEFHFNSGNFEDIFGNFGPFGFGRQQRRNKSLNINIEITLEDVLNGKKLDAEISLPNGSTKLISIEIPPGIDHGQQIKYSGMGDHSLKDAPPGDLIVNVYIRNNTEFQRQGDMLITKKIVSVWDAILGSSIEIKTLDGKTLNITVPPGTQPETMLSCKNEGLPNMRSRKRGNLMIKIQIDIPRNLNEVQLKQIKNIRDGI